MSPDQPKAVVLLSGGLDSATTAAMAKKSGYAVYALTFMYGQRHAVESEAAKRVAQAIGVAEHRYQKIDLRAFGGSALTDDIDVPKSPDADHMPKGIPVTYVPARNTIFLSFAVGYAEVIGAFDIFMGVSAVDYSGYPDCRPEFISSFQQTARLGTKAGIEGAELTIHAPLIDMSKAETIREAHRLGVDLALTHSCYDPDPSGKACGSCDSCLLRSRGFEEAGLPDPTIYVQSN
ncbi:MAG: 7-cyano-7-deazaguanine synthase QueC [Planctomycetota bacterium]